MGVELNHTIVPVQDKEASATFLAEILGLDPAEAVRALPLRRDRQRRQPRLRRPVGPRAPSLRVLGHRGGVRRYFRPRDRSRPDLLGRPGPPAGEPHQRPRTRLLLRGSLGPQHGGSHPALRKLTSDVVLLVDAANVIGSRPTGWWKDRPGAARAFVERVRAAVRTRSARPDPVVVVLEGKARDGVDPGEAEGVTVVHAPRSGDDKLLEVIAGADGPVTLVSADRALCERAGTWGPPSCGPDGFWAAGRLSAYWHRA